MPSTQDSLHLLSQFQWLVYYDQDNPDRIQPLSALAYQQALIRFIPQLNASLAPANGSLPYAGLHFYPLDHKLVYLGGRDLRLPRLQAGLDFLSGAGYPAVVRPHGGLAVVCDPGILNVSLVLDRSDLGTQQAYQVFVSFLGKVLAGYDLALDSYEVPQSYCPGDFDLVVQGQKIGGLAQRRYKSGLSVAAYLSVSGDQDQRGRLVRDFYQEAGAGASYPQVDPRSMANLSDFLGPGFHRQELEKGILQTLQTLAPVQAGDLSSPGLQADYQEALDAMHQQVHRQEAKLQVTFARTEGGR